MTKESNFIKAVRSEKKGDAERALLDGADINFRDEYNETALGWATCEGSESMVEFLLAQEDIDVNKAPTKGEYQGYTPLINAAERDSSKFVEILVKRKGVDLNAKSASGMTPLFVAIRYGRVENVKLLVEHGADIYHNGKTIKVWLNVIKKAEENAEKDGAYLAGLKKVKHYLQEQEELGSTLIKVAKENNMEDAKKALASGADINFRDKHDDTALVCITYLDCKDMVKFLLEQDNIDVNSSPRSGDYKGYTSLMCVARRGDPEVFELLVKHKGADLNAVAADGMTALLTAIKFGKVDYVKSLVEHGANINHGGKEVKSWQEVIKEAKVEVYRYGYVTDNLSEIERYLIEKEKASLQLIEAAKENNVEGVKKALADGADINFRDKDNDTALGWGAYLGHKGVVKFLLEQDNIDVNISPRNGNYRGYTPIMYASVLDDPEVVKLLVKHKDVDVNAAATNGLTPFLRAVKHGKLENVKLLIKKGVDINQQSEKVKSWRCALSWGKRAGADAASLRRVSLYLKQVEEQVEDEIARKRRVGILECAVNDEDVPSLFFGIVDSFCGGNDSNADEFKHANNMDPNLQLIEAAGENDVAVAEMAIKRGAEQYKVIIQF